MADDNRQLPAVLPASATVLSQLTQSLGIPRAALPSDEVIRRVWDQLPRLINEVPAAYRTEHHLRMCIAVASGLFDSAINYVWNAAVLRLRDRVRAFGLQLVPQVTSKPFDEATLTGLKDVELVDLCLRLNLISEEASFFLNQCREVRNNFSSAHPAMGALDDLEVLTYLNRCTKHAFADVPDLRGVDLPDFLQAIKAGGFTDEQTAEWVRRLRETHDAQRETAVGTLHGIYCDPVSNEEARLNCLRIARELAREFSPATKSLLINRHSDYIAKGEDNRRTASRIFFQELGLLDLLGDSERHALFSHAAHQLRSVHNGFDNFYNEPPFAERLLLLSQQTPVPASAQKEFVETIIMCAIGNPYGVSNAAEPTYHALVRNFSPQEVAYMLAAPSVEPSVIRGRVTQNASCRQRFKNLVGLLDATSVSASARRDYQWWLEN